MPRTGAIEDNLIVVGLDSRHKQRHFAGLAARRAQQIDIEHTVSRLGEIRRNTVANLDSLKEQFSSRLSEKGGVEVFLADDAARAVSIIDRLSGDRKALAINRASAIGELGPLLEQGGHRLINTYLAGYPQEEGVEKVLNHYWQLPLVSAESAYESFVVQSLSPADGRKNYTALLGVTAAAAEDGSIYFLQHTSNIGTMLQEARRLIVVVGLEKIVETREDALLQTRCMGAFGLESVILDLKYPGTSQEAAELANLPMSDSPPEVHVILLDNGRSRIAQDDRFRELLTCISCRACAMHCPTHEYFSSERGNYPKQYLWSYLIGSNRSLDMCTGCGMCYLSCPLDINIPNMASISRSQESTRRPWMITNRMLNDPWLLMRAASRSAPLANQFLKNRLARILIEKSVGLQRDAWVPRARRRTFDQWYRSHHESHDR